MNKKEIEKNLGEIIKLYNSLQNWLHDLLKWIKQEGKERWILDDFLNYLWLEKNDETRYVAYTRIVSLKEDSLELYLEKLDLVEKEKRKIIDLSYNYVCDFHSEIQAVIISVIETKNLLTPFYLEIFKWVANVWLAFNELFLPWRNHIVYWVNKNLEEKFYKNSDKIIEYLNQNNLYDKWHDWLQADRSYSALVVDETWNYKSKAYVEVFEKEIKLIIIELEKFIDKLSKLEDDIYDSKDEYLKYLEAIKDAFLEKNVDNLTKKWSLVDEKWMKIKTPFQIWHPLEYYEDKYRKAVAPEWDLRIINNVFESNVEESILKMYEIFYDEIWREKYKSSYEFSLNNLKRVQLYLSSPILYYSSELSWLFSAQVVPNDEVISKKYWKKIFAFPEMVLKNKRKEPFMQITSEIFDIDFINKYRKSLFWKDEIFYKIYDIETIGHEYWHTLWLDLDTDVLMNKKTWIQKNIEEFKATTWGLVMYFMDENIALEYKQDLLIHHIYRSVNLLKYREVNDIEPYYCEVLIHLFILFESKIIIFNNENKIQFVYNEENYNNLKQTYIRHYRQLINIYLNKIDAWEFLNIYVFKDNWIYLPKDKKIRDFVEYYYWLYKKIWNEIDESISKGDYL